MRRRIRKVDPLRLTSRLAAAAACAVVLLGAVWALAMPTGAGQPQLVTVALGQSVSDTASLLSDHGLIRSPLVFSLTAYATGKWRRIRAGRYELSRSMSALEILDALCCGQRKAWRWVTIPEGYTLQQIAEEVERREIASAQEFARQAQDLAGLSPGFPLAAVSPEGYLFPDTYRVDAGASAQAVLAQMLRRFNEVVWKGMFRGNPTYDGRSLSDIITLASLVEGEAKKDDERAIVAGVLMNRLRRGIKLECDATVQYALGDGRKPRLTHEDLLVDSDYNTYLHLGLPPGPICNPGEASIRAAMDPADVPYLYYVARPDGSHVFSRTFADHQAAIARVRRER
jgi:UPF0755 protein